MLYLDIVVHAASIFVEAFGWHLLSLVVYQIAEGFRCTEQMTHDTETATATRGVTTMAKIICATVCPPDPATVMIRLLQD